MKKFRMLTYDETVHKCLCSVWYTVLPWCPERSPQRTGTAEPSIIESLSSTQTPFSSGWASWTSRKSRRNCWERAYIEIGHFAVTRNKKECSPGSIYISHSLIVIYKITVANKITELISGLYLLSSLGQQHSGSHPRRQVNSWGKHQN